MANRTGREFMERTRFRYLGQSDQMKGIPCPPLELPYDETQPVIDMPQPGKTPVKAITVTEAIENRRSIRTYSDSPLSLNELSYLLWCTQGVIETIPGSATFRTVPSAGARHAFETYLLVNNVKGLSHGLYRFLALDHKLLSVSEDYKTVAEGILKGCLGQEMVVMGAVTFLWIAVPFRMTWRYGERGYRYLHLDVGHVCQNLYLAAEEVDCGVCAIGAYDDDMINYTLALKEEKQFTIYIAAVGKK
ncbi:SagB/ThcOx family dehydrogenase [Candidatus Latescibacterota bacterium]